MILVDSRAGSCDLVKPLAALGLPIEETTLDFGDVCFMGRGEKGSNVFIGIEHKRISDLVSALTTGRLAGHQLPGMLSLYDRSWLVIEGEWQSDTQGRTTMFKGRRRLPLKGAPAAVDLEKRILCLETRGGFRVRICPTRRDTLRFLYALYRFWTDKDLDEHKSHLAIHSPDLDRGIQIPISDFRRLAAQIPGLGYASSGAVEKAVAGSFTRLLKLTPAQLAEVVTIDSKGKSRRLGLSRAEQILKALK